MHFTVLRPEEIYDIDAKLKQEDVQILQEWLNKQPHLPTIEEEQLLVFLHSCYYSVEATKITIDAYFTRKTLHPEIFHYPGEDIVRQAFKSCFSGILPKRTPQGYAIFFTKLMDFNAENYKSLFICNATNLIYTLTVHKSGIIDGLVAIFDVKGFTLAHFVRINLSATRNSVAHLQEGCPVRLKEIHFINTVPFMDKLMALVKGLVNSEIYNMIKLHSSLDSLYKYVPRECLPEDFGGGQSATKILHEDNIKEVLEHEEFFKWHDSQIVDESKRQEKSNISQNFGVQGTFKKLQID